MKIFCILGSSGSGKTELALKLAQDFNGVIFSLDSLSIYKEVNIASAKPSTADLAKVKHYAINELEPSQPCSVMDFWRSLENAIRTEDPSYLNSSERTQVQNALQTQNTSRAQIQNVQFSSQNTLHAQNIQISESKQTSNTPQGANSAKSQNPLNTKAHQSTKLAQKKALFIVGGSSFYLKAMLDGISQMPHATESKSQEVRAQISKISQPYEFLQAIDSEFAQNIKPSDTYRIQKAIEVYFLTQTAPSAYFSVAPKLKFHALQSASIFVLDIDRQILKERIFQRTREMIKNGILQEIQNLAQKYPLDSQIFKAIGVKETLEFLSQNNLLHAKLDSEFFNPDNAKLQNLISQISTHTAQLAKRQTTFNRTQFKTAKLLNQKQIYEQIKGEINEY